MARHYKTLPKKYVLMLRGSFADYNFHDVIWSCPTIKGGFVYYVYETRVQGDCDKVYRFTKEEHEELLSKITSDDVHELDKGWIQDCCDPYIVTDKVF